MQMLYLLKNIDKTKFDVYLVILYENSQLKKEFYALKDVTVLQFSKKCKFNIIIYFKIYQFIKKNNIKIISTFLGNHHSYIPALFSNNCIAIGGIRNTYQSKLSIFGTILRSKMLRILTSIDKFYFISNSNLGRNIYTSLGIPKNSLYVIPNGIDVPKFQKGNRTKILNELKLKNKIVLGMVARLIKCKNHEALIQMFHEIQNENEKLLLCLLLVGDGDQMKHLVNLVYSLGLQEKVIFTGLRKDVADLLSAMDIFVFPTLCLEGWPNAIGEAMASGLPIISYPAGDISTIITSNYNGIITKPNMKSFKEATLAIMKNTDLMKQLGENARRSVESKYGIKTMVKNYEKLYTQLISVRGGGP